MTPKFSSPMRLNIQMNVVSMKAKTATNAMRLAAMPTTAPTAFEAPNEMASNTFFASL